MGSPIDRGALQECAVYTSSPIHIAMTYAELLATPLLFATPNGGAATIPRPTTVALPLFGLAGPSRTKRGRRPRGQGKRRELEQSPKQWAYICANQDALANKLNW